MHYVFLLSWLSKSSSASNYRFIIFIVVIVTIFVIDAIPIVIDTVIRAVIIYWAKFFARTTSQPSTNTQCSSPTSFIPFSLSFVCEDLTQVGSTVIRGRTWLHYDESKDLAFCFLCNKASTFDYQVDVQIRPLHLQGFPIGKMPLSSLKECSYRCNCLPYLWKVSSCIVAISVIDRHLAVIAGHDSFVLYVWL